MHESSVFISKSVRSCGSLTIVLSVHLVLGVPMIHSPHSLIKLVKRRAETTRRERRVRR